MSQDEVNKLVERLGNMGAKITMLDPRVTQAQVWLQGTMAVALMAVIAWSVQRAQVLSENMMLIQVQSQYIIKQLDQIDNQRRDDVTEARRQIDRLQKHIESVDGRVTVMEQRGKP